MNPEESFIHARSVAAEPTVTLPVKGNSNTRHLNAKDLNSQSSRQAVNDYNGLLNHIKQYNNGKAARLNSSQHQAGLDASLLQGIESKVAQF